MCRWTINLACRLTINLVHASGSQGQQSALMVIGNLVLDPPSRKRLAQTSGARPPHPEMPRNAKR